MAYTFSDALMEAKRRARLQGRTVSQQEASGIAEGYAGQTKERALQEYQVKSQEKQFAEQLAAQKEQYAGNLSLKEREMAQQNQQYYGSLAAQKSQFSASLANTKEQFGREMSLKENAFAEERETNRLQLEQAKNTLAEQIRQYNESSETQKQQYGEQMAQQIKESEAKISQWQAEMDRRTYEFEENLKLQREMYESQIKAAEAANNDDGGTWICTETQKTVGMSKAEKKAMRKLRKYTKQEHPEWLTSYYFGGQVLIKAIARKVEDAKAFYEEIRKTLVSPVVELVKAGDLEGAFRHYKDLTVKLAAEHSPELLGTLAEA